MNNLKVVDILLVEDNPADAEMTIRGLKKKNLANNLFHVEDGAEALDFIFGQGKYADRETMRYNPKVILLDLKLPKVDGLEVLKKIRSDERTKMIPVVILTSSKEDRDIIEGYRLGTNAYVVKPVDFDSFMQAVVDLGMFWMLMNQVPKQ